MSDNDYDSGPFCKHWGDPGTCETCALENVAEFEGITVEELRLAIKTLYELKQKKDKQEGNE